MKLLDMNVRSSRRYLQVATAFLALSLLHPGLRGVAYADTWTGTCVCNYDDPALSCHTSVFLTGTSVADLSQKCASATSSKGNLINLAKRTTPPSIMVNWCVAGPAPAGLPFEHATIGSKSDYWFCFDGVPGKTYNTWCNIGDKFTPGQYCRADGATSCGALAFAGVGATSI